MTKCYFSFSCLLFLFAALTYIAAFDAAITIEENGRTLSIDEISAAKNAPSVKWKSVDGYIPNEAVVGASYVAAYREGEFPPYFFRIFLPKEIQPNVKYPLILWLHGLGESLDDNKSQLAHMQWSIETLAGPNRPDFFLVAVQCPQETGSWYTSDPRAPHGESPLEMVDKITETLINEYPVDIDRISLLGICSGASAGFRLFQQFPRRFSAFTACSASPPPETVEAFRHLPIWMFNNSDDPEGWYDNKPLADSVNRVGGDFFLTVRDFGGHDTWTSAQRDDHVLEWLLRQRRGKMVFPRGVPALDRSKGNLLVMFGLPIIITLFCLFIDRKLEKKEKVSHE